MVAAADDPPRRPRIPSPGDKRIPSSSAAAAANGNHDRHSLNPRRRTLHNFSFPPTLAWGNQRVLRCVNLPSAAGVGGGGGNHNHNKSSSESDPKPKAKRAEEEAESSPARPWNLRARRANPNRISSAGNQTPSPAPNRSSSPSPSPPSPTILNVERGNSVRISARSEGEDKGGGDGGSGDGGSKGERSKFAVSLGREEIEEDFLKMKGSKPPRRPKKRAKYIQRQLDSLFPGLWLSEITPDLYKIDLERT